MISLLGLRLRRPRLKGCVTHDRLVQDPKHRAHPLPPLLRHHPQRRADGLPQQARQGSIQSLLAHPVREFAVELGIEAVDSKRMVKARQLTMSL